MQPIQPATVIQDQHDHIAPIAEDRQGSLTDVIDEPSTTRWDRDKGNGGGDLVAESVRIVFGVPRTLS